MVLTVEADINTVICLAVFELFEIPEHILHIAVQPVDKVFSVFSFGAEFSESDQHGIIICHIVR